MTDEKELRKLIERARNAGAIIRTRHNGGHDDLIEAVMVRSGIPGVGQGWMTPIAAAERLREFAPLSKHIDFTYSQGCGCQVTFFCVSDYHTSRMLCGETCTIHRPKGLLGMDARNKLQGEAKEALAKYLKGGA